MTKQSGFPFSEGNSSLSSSSPPRCAAAAQPTTRHLVLSECSSGLARRQRHRITRALKTSAMRKCLFCDNDADTREHVWSQWILERVWQPKRNPTMYGIAGKRDLHWSGPRPELRIRCVCGGCNHGWMSNLESAAIPLISPLIHDISVPLDATQQWIIAIWVVKTAMVMEAVGHKYSFFTASEREQIRASRILPGYTNIFLARYAGINNVAFFGIDVFDQMPNPESYMTEFHGYVNTIVAGYFVAQVLSLHVPAKYGERPIIHPREGPWNRLELQIWGQESQKPVTWPTRLA